MPLQVDALNFGKVEWTYVAGTGALKWKPLDWSARKNREKLVLQRVAARVEHWLNLLLTPAQKEEDRVFQVTELWFWAAVGSVDEVDAAAEQIGRTIAGNILHKLLGDDRRNWPTVPDTERNPDVTMRDMLVA